MSAPRIIAFSPAPIPFDGTAVGEAMAAIDRDHHHLAEHLARLAVANPEDIPAYRDHLSALSDLLHRHFAAEEALIGHLCGEAWLGPHRIEHAHLLRVVEDSLHYAASPGAAPEPLAGLGGVICRWLHQEVKIGDPSILSALARPSHVVPRAARRAGNAALK